MKEKMQCWFCGNELEYVETTNPDCFGEELDVVILKCNTCNAEAKYYIDEWED